MRPHPRDPGEAGVAGHKRGHPGEPEQHCRATPGRRRCTRWRSSPGGVRGVAPMSMRRGHTYRPTDATASGDDRRVRGRDRHPCPKDCAGPGVGGHLRAGARRWRCPVRRCPGPPIGQDGPGVGARDHRPAPTWAPGRPRCPRRHGRVAEAFRCGGGAGDSGAAHEGPGQSPTRPTWQCCAVVGGGCQGEAAGRRCHLREWGRRLAAAPVLSAGPRRGSGCTRDPPVRDRSPRDVLQAP